MAVRTCAETGHGLNRRLYDALTTKNNDKVIELCQSAPEGPLHITSVHKDTVLHLACYSKQLDLAIQLMSLLPRDHNQSLSEVKNDVGNTVLHEAATCNNMGQVAKRLLQREPNLLGAPNFQGETPLFRAARYGKTPIFELLADEVDKDENRERREKQFQSGDKTSILHIAVIAEHFDLALLIVKRYPDLIGMKDGNNMTALQHLSVNPSAFRSGRKPGFFRRLIYRYIEIKEKTRNGTRGRDSKGCVLKWPRGLGIWKEVEEEVEKHSSAWELAQKLIELDTSWELIEKTSLNLGKSDPEKTYALSKTGKEGLSSDDKEKGKCSSENKKTKFTMKEMRTDDTPLFLATKWRIEEIVKEILRNYPQAVEHVDKKGRNILHVAIQYRHEDIFDEVRKRSDMVERRLLRATDSKGNSLLHMVGKRRKGDHIETVLGPALDLREQLLLFQKVEGLVKSDFISLFNHKMETAKELFSSNYSQLHEDAKKWLEETSKNCTIVAVLIATVAFAAAYTVPGGVESNGMPVLISQPFFVVFALTDVMSLTFALASVVSFLAILTSPFRMDDFHYSLPNKLITAFTFLISSVTTMMVAFAATIILMIRNKQSWTKIALYSVAFLPVIAFAFSYSPLYLHLLKGSAHFFQNILRARSPFRSQSTSSSNPPHPSNRSRSAGRNSEV